MLFFHFVKHLSYLFSVVLPFPPKFNLIPDTYFDMNFSQVLSRLMSQFFWDAYVHKIQNFSQILREVDNIFSREARLIRWKRPTIFDVLKFTKIHHNWSKEVKFQMIPLPNDTLGKSLATNHFISLLSLYNSSMKFKKEVIEN